MSEPKRKRAGRPTDMPDAERWPHGVRARYVCGCRCALCRAANVKRYHERKRQMGELAAGVTPSGPPLEGELVRAGRTFRVKRCPGANGKPCVCSEPAWLRGQGPVCGRCLERATVWDGLVSAGRVRQHLRKLSRQGVGYKSVADACDVGHTTLLEIITGKNRRIRALAAKRILAVTEDAVADHAVVSGERLLRLIEKLQEEGFTKAELARRLGYKRPALQFRKKVLAKTAHRFKQFYIRVTT